MTRLLSDLQCTYTSWPSKSINLQTARPPINFVISYIYIYKKQTKNILAINREFLYKLITSANETLINTKCSVLICFISTEC